MKKVKYLLTTILIVFLGLLIREFVKDFLLKKVKTVKSENNVASLDSLEVKLKSALRTSLIQSNEAYELDQNKELVLRYVNCVWENWRSEIIPYVLNNTQPPKGISASAVQKSKEKCNYLIVDFMKDDFMKDDFSPKDDIITLTEDSYFDNLKSGAQITVSAYLKNREMSNIPPSSKFIYNEKGEKYLVIQYYTGGAHCCTKTEVFFPEVTYKKIYEFGQDGDAVGINYPFSFHNYHNYFYSCYACGISLECNYDLIPEQTLVGKKLLNRVKGSKEGYLQCFKDFLGNNEIPELENETDDNGERELILNSIELLNLAGMTYDELLFIYKNNTNNFTDKKKLWIEILEEIGCKDQSIINRHKEILNLSN